MSLETLLEYSIKGALVIAAALIIAAGWAVYLTLIILYSTANKIWEVGCWIRHAFFPPEPVYPEIHSELELLRANKEIQERNEEEERKKRLELRIKTEEPETTLDDEEKEEPVEQEYDLSAPLHLDNQLTFSQKEKLYAKGYQVLKTSAFGDSGAAHYWVMPRHNESKEHAFFCYLLEAELKKHVSEVELHVTRGPDVVVTWKGKKYCFDVETGKSLSRQPDWLAKKFEYYQREYDKSFILITKRTLKYKYAKYGIVITRAMIKETIKKLFRKTVKQPKKRGKTRLLRQRR